MNKETYRQAFSGVRPSDELTERLCPNAMKTKNRTHIKRLLAVTAATIAILLCAGVGVNAATQGAVTQGVRMVIGGDVDFWTYVKNYRTYLNEDGETVREFTYSDDVLSCTVYSVDDGEDVSNGDPKASKFVIYEIYDLMTNADAQADAQDTAPAAETDG